MWLLFRIIVVLLVTLLRFYWRHRSVEAMGPWKGAMLFRRKSGRQSETLGFAFDTPLIFELIPESRSDRLVKKLGLVVEQQTGDASFDQRVYIRCDHPSLGQLLRKEETARSACLALFSHGVRRIAADGTRIWMEIPRVAIGSSELLSSLNTLRECLGGAHAFDHSRHKDYFLWRAALAEAAVWGLAAYAFTGLFTVLQLGDVPQAASRIIYLSLLAALGLGTLFSVLIFMMVGRSSRAKFILWESALVMTFAVPVASGSLVMDTNRTFDRHPPEVAHYKIVEKQAIPYTKEGRRGAVTVIDYMIRVEPVNPNDPRIPRYLPVTYALYASDVEILTVELGPGALGIPWIKSIEAEPSSVRPDS